MARFSLRRLVSRIRYGVPWDAAVIGAVFAVVLGYGAWLHLRDHRARLPVGAPCYRGDECRSGMCLELYEPVSGLPVVAERRGGVCGSNCDDDADCPAAMRCAPVVQESAPTAPMLEGAPIPIGDANAKACAPRRTAPLRKLDNLGEVSVCILPLCPPSYGRRNWTPTAAAAVPSELRLA